MYSRTYMILLENAVNNSPEDVDTYFLKAENAILENIRQSPEDSQEGYLNLSKIYERLTEHHHFNPNYWKKAIAYIRKSIKIAPEEGSWNFYLNLLYVPSELGNTDKTSATTEKSERAFYKQWHLLKEAEREHFNQLAQKVIEENHAAALKIALAFYGLRKRLEWLKADMAIFPEERYLFWLGEAQKVSGHSTTRPELIEEAHFLHNEGKRLGRIDLLKAAIMHYQRMIEAVEAPAFEVYYKASALEDIALTYHNNNNVPKAEAYFDQAYDVYEKHLSLVKSNPSVFTHYTEYLERCYNYSGNIKKPSLAYLKEQAKITEEEGQGMNSTPTMLRIRLALLENNENEAIFHLTRLLLLHELSIDSNCKELKHQVQSQPLVKLNAFLDETLLFMREVEAGYYLDHTIKWESLKKLTAQEVNEAWESRKEEIRNRKKVL